MITYASVRGLVPRLRMRGAVPPFPQYGFVVWCFVAYRDNVTCPSVNFSVGNLHQQLYIQIFCYRCPCAVATELSVSPDRTEWTGILSCLILSQICFWICKPRDCILAGFNALLCLLAVCPGSRYSLAPNQSIRPDTRGSAAVPGYSWEGKGLGWSCFRRRAIDSVLHCNQQPLAHQKVSG
jgi:hypothetical protein